jgi:hypothetical protein
VWFDDPATLNNPWIWSFALCTDAPGYGLTDAGGGGFLITVEAPTIPVPQAGQASSGRTRDCREVEALRLGVFFIVIGLIFVK